jgi:hypothetical protein
VQTYILFKPLLLSDKTRPNIKAVKNKMAMRWLNTARNRIQNCDYK